LPEYANIVRNYGGLVRDGESILYSWAENYGGFTVTTTQNDLSWVRTGMGGWKIVNISCSISVVDTVNFPRMAIYVNGSYQNTLGTPDEPRKSRAIPIPVAGNYSLTSTLYLAENSLIEIKIIGGSVNLSSLGTCAALSCCRIK
jgi:hypothetical protein